MNILAGITIMWTLACVFGFILIGIDQGRKRRHKHVPFNEERGS